MSGETRGSTRRLLIVGGGSAGWLAAAYLSKILGTERTGGPRITVLESPEIGTIGVGEGTFPSIRGLLNRLGIDEAEFLRECNATFKQGVRFVDWETAPANGRHSAYFHPFEGPAEPNDLNLLPHWLTLPQDEKLPFAEAVTAQTRLSEGALSPKRRHQGQFEGTFNYAYHFDATRFANFLARYAKLQGVYHLQGTVTEVRLADDGAIASVMLAEQGAVTADLYLDCTGFRSELLGKAMGVPFKSVTDTLFVDRAIACQVPYDKPDAPIASYTISAAHEAGWTWDIGLSERRGVGYVYSSRHASDDQAADTLMRYIDRSGHGAANLTPRLLKFETGYRARHWVKNCIAIGLSGGFLEPLEATGLTVIQSAIIKLAEFFPHHGPVDVSADLFNGQMARKYENIINFLKLHYCLSRRTEPFWRDNTVSETIPSTLQEKLTLWRHRPPSRFDFVEDDETFAYTSYQYILYGLRFPTNLGRVAGEAPRAEEAGRVFAAIQAAADREARELPTHRAMIDMIYRDGFASPPRQVQSGIGAGFGAFHR